jgi:hypothetical protein
MLKIIKIFKAFYTKESHQPLKGACADISIIVYKIFLTYITVDDDLFVINWYWPRFFTVILGIMFYAIFIGKVSTPNEPFWFFWWHIITIIHI